MTNVDIPTGTAITEFFTRSEVCMFVIERSLEEADELEASQMSQYGPGFLRQNVGIARYLDDIGDLESLGDMAALYAWHPDYQNWPAHPHAQHQNSPRTFNDADGALA